MDDTLQQALALLIVAVAIGAELWRRHRRKTQGKAGCEGCSTSSSTRTRKKDGRTESPLRFYQRR